MPVPDVEPTPPVYVPPKPLDHSARKWLYISLAIAGFTALAGVAVFALYVYFSNTPNYMLSAAVNNAVKSSGMAGDFTYDSLLGNTTRTLKGGFVAYSDPTDSRRGLLTANLGQDTASISASIRLFPGANYVQVTGLDNLGRLVGSVRGDSSKLTPDKLVQLSSLDGPWYSLTSDDLLDVEGRISLGVLSGSPNSLEFQTMQKLYLEHPFVTVAQQYSDERISSVNCMHLRLSIDRDKLAEYLTAVKGAGLKSLTITDQGIAAVKSNEWLGKVQVETWIARSDKTFQQFKATWATSDNQTDTVTVVLRSELVATQRQTVVQPASPQSAVQLLEAASGLVPGVTTSTP